MELVEATVTVYRGIISATTDIAVTGHVQTEKIVLVREHQPQPQELQRPRRQLSHRCLPQESLFQQSLELV